ncbi:MAG: 30S ribosomal protein S6 [Anaerolineales bacterium]|nr:30S ribosomal protein S6 [Anaerolineales bacterium]
MRNYELVCIIQADLDENVFKETLERIQGWVTESGGSVDKTEDWGRRKLAYMIHKQTEGHYMLLNITLDPKSTGELERNIRFLEPVTRHMLTVV